MVGRRGPCWRIEGFDEVIEAARASWVAEETVAAWMACDWNGGDDREIVGVLEESDERCGVAIRN